jgi:hypothetical protein
MKILMVVVFTYIMAYSQERQAIAVLNLKADNVSESIVNILSNKTHRFRISVRFPG